MEFVKESISGEIEILANDHYMTVALNNLALVADFLNGRLYFQSCYHLSEI